MPGNRCLGLYALDRHGRGCDLPRTANHLATGGAGKVYLYTTNPTPPRATASRWLGVQAAVANMEFIQFHPTGLYHLHESPFLISEAAVRGEGGKLLLPDRPVANASCPTTTHAPSWPRATWWPAPSTSRMKKRGLDCVHLDIAHQAPRWLRSTSQHPRARCLAGHRHHEGAIRWCPRCTSPAAASSDRPGGRTDVPGLTPWARWPAPACTA